MRDLQWGKIAKLQDELVHQQEKRKKQRQTYHKMLYKHELETMMSEKSQHLRNQVQSERKKYSESYRTLVESKQTQDYDRSEQEKRSKIQIMVKENSDYNYNSNKNRRIRMRSELQEDQSLHRDKYRKAETERSQERQSESLQRMKRRRQLAQAYQEQINTNTSRKYLQKLQNQKFQQLALELENKKQIERQNHINKIRYGYSQNPQAYETIKQIYNKKQEVKQAFLRKLQIDKCPTEQNALRKKSQTIEASNYNKKYSILREQHKKQQLARETEQENLKLSNIQEKLRLEMYHDRLIRQAKRKELKDDLESQMSEAAIKRLSWQKMSPDEHRINQSYLNLLHPLSVPGLGKDYRDIKKDQIIDQFLKNKSALSYVGQ